MESEIEESSNENCSRSVSHSYGTSMEGTLMETDELMDPIEMILSASSTTGSGFSGLGSGLRERDLSLCGPVCAEADAITAENAMDESFMIKMCIREGVVVEAEEINELDDSNNDEQLHSM